MPTVLFRAFDSAHGSGRFQPHHRTGYGAWTVDSSSLFPSTQPGQARPFAPALQLAKRPSSQAVRRGPGLSIKGHRLSMYTSGPGSPCRRPLEPRARDGDWRTSHLVRSCLRACRCSSARARAGTRRGRGGGRSSGGRSRDATSPLIHAGAHRGSVLSCTLFLPTP